MSYSPGRARALIKCFALVLLRSLTDRLTVFGGRGGGGGDETYLVHKLPHEAKWNEYAYLERALHFCLFHPIPSNGLVRHWVPHTRTRIRF